MKKYLPYIILFIIGCLLSLDLFHPGYPLTHDGRDHIVRIANFYLSLTQGIIIPRWAENLNWGYGHPILMFLYPLPSYFASLFHFLGASFIDAYKLVLGLGIVASGITMYLWLQEFVDTYSSLFGAILYMFAPYRMVDVYVRGDIGENLAFVFVPLVLLALKKLSKKVSLVSIVWGGIALSGVILSHNAIALMVMPFFILYALIEWHVTENKKYVLYASGLFVLGFGFASFFWIPALLEGKYTLRNIVTAGVYISRFVNLSQLIYGPWNYGQTGSFTLQLGLFQWGGIIISFFYALALCVKRKFLSETTLVIMTSIFFTVVSIFLMLPNSNFIWAHVMLLQNFQFPWRFLGLIVLTSSILVAYTFSLITKYKTGVFFVCLLILFIFQSQYFHAQAYVQKPQGFFTGVFDGTTDTGESSPIWSIRFMEHRPDAPTDVLSGHAHIATILPRTSIEHTYVVDASEEATLLENTLYFPGWHIFIDGRETQIQYQDQLHHGLMEFTVSPGQHRVSVVFTDTKVRKIAQIISILSIISLTLILFLRKNYEY